MPMPDAPMTSEERAAYDEARRRIDQSRLEGFVGGRLDLSKLGLTRVPPEIGCLNSVRELYLGDNLLVSLPPEIRQLKGLRSLLLAHNEFQHFPEHLCDLIQLRILSLSFNRIDSLPPKIGQLLNLSELRLFNNQIADLPPQIGNLKSLKGLDLRCNRIAQLPKEIGQLVGLTRLYLHSNLLAKLPIEICQLPMLAKLDLHSNLLDELPDCLSSPGSLPRLRQIALHDNPGLGIPNDSFGPTADEVSGGLVLPRSPREILDLYFATRGDQGQAFREFRMIVVGRGRAGKTSLIRRLNGEAMDMQEAETHGVNVSKMAVQCQDGPLLARAWDFGGQHVLHAMHEMFLSARCLYLVVLNQRDDSAVRDAAYWLQLIRSYAPDAPVVMAVNQSEGVMRPVNQAEFEQKYGPIAAWVATECLPDEKCPGASATIENLRQTLTAAADVMAEPRKLFPKKWIDIKRRLEDMQEPFLEQADFVAECAKRGESDPAKAEELAALMHDLGIALNYGRDPRLRDTTVLRPDWLANGIYAVLRANLLERSPLAADAVLTADKLGLIYTAADKAGMLRSAEYPKEKWPFLLRLMSLFQLSFPLDEAGNRQLAPALLPASLTVGMGDEMRAEPHERSDAGMSKLEAGSTFIRYEFGVLPAPVLGRFMVKLFPLIERRGGQLMAWQSGALLKYGAARGRISADEKEQYLFLTVAGDDRDRGELLEMARVTLQEIFRSYPRLLAKEQWLYEGEWVPRGTLERFKVLEKEDDYDEMFEREVMRA